jgi:recombination protein RecT
MPLKEENIKATPAPAKQESPLQIMKRTVVDIVAAKVHGFIQNGELHLPRDYSVENAIKSAWLILQTVEDKDHNKALAVCTRDSIANALLDMIVQGLNPGKRQVYFIAYGKILVAQRSYFGSMAVAQMVDPRVREFSQACVYEGDKFKYGIVNGKKSVTLHEQDIDNVDKRNILAAYAVALDKDGNPLRTDIMTIDEIHQAWRQSKVSPFDERGNVKDASTHGKFAADMAQKTVTNRLCKMIINASSDSALLLDAIKRNDELADSAAVAEEIEERANAGDVLELAAAADEITGEVMDAAGYGEQVLTPEAPKQEGRAPGF